MVRLALSALVAAVALAGCGGGGKPAEAPRPGAAQGDTFAEVFRVVEQWRQGWEVRSLEALAPLYRQDDHTVIVYQGRPLRGWPAAQTWLRTQLAGSASVHLRIEDGVVSSLGADSAVFAARMGRDSSDGVLTRSDEGFLTLTFARAGDRWQIVAEHYSYPLGGR